MTQIDLGTAWRVATALTWYFANRPFDEFFAVAFPDHGEPPAGRTDYYADEWRALWAKRDFVQIFARLDFRRQQAVLGEVLNLYAADAAKQLVLAEIA